MHYEWEYVSGSILICKGKQDVLRAQADLPAGKYTITKTYVVDHNGGRMPISLAVGEADVVHGFAIQVKGEG